MIGNQHTVALTWKKEESLTHCPLFTSVKFQLILWINILNVSCKIVVWLMQQNSNDD